MTRLWHRIDSHWLRMVKEFLPPNLVQPIWTAEIRQRAVGIVSLLQGNQPAAAVAAAEEVLPLVQTQAEVAAFVLAMKACGELQIQEFAAAIATLDQATRYSPGEPRLIYSTGLIELRRGRVEVATEHFERAVAADESLGQAWAALAVIRALEQDHVRAEVAARRALACGVALDGELVNLALFQSTYRQGKPAEGCCDLSSLVDDSAAIVERLLPGFPPVAQQDIRHPDDGRPILFLYADQAYVERHAVGLVLSLAAVRPRCRIHLHVANPSEKLRAILQHLEPHLEGMPLVVSAETVPATLPVSPGIYHSCIRFVRFLQVLECNQQPAMLLDVDLLGRKNPLQLFDDHPEADVVLAQAEFDPLWGQFFGGMVAIRPTTAGLSFARRVASLILDNFDKQTSRWFLDQIALAVSYDQKQGEVRFATVPKPAVASRTFAPESYFSSVVNEQKHAENQHNNFKRTLLHQSGLAALLAG
jgi:hypothetical protein